MPPSSTVCSHNTQCILDTAGHTSDPAGCLDCFHPRPLIRADPAGWRLDLDAGEYRHLLAHHLRGDRDAPVADQVGAALAEAEADRSAVLVLERAGVIAPKPGSAGAARYADVLLDGLLRCQALQMPRELH